MDMKDSLSYEDVPVEILNRQVRRLRNKEVASVKVLWRSQSVEGATWEAEAAMKCNVFACPWNSVQSEIQFFVFSGGTHGHHPRTVGGPTVCPAGLWFLLANSPRNQPKIRPSVDPRQDLRFIGQVTNRGSLHPVFHISLLKKCVGDPASLVPLECMDMKDSLSYEDVPVEILNRQVRRLRNKEVASVKVLWRSQSVEGATWEAEAAMKCNVFACPWNSVQSEIQFFVFSGGTHGHHPRTVGGPTVCPAGLWFLLANSPRNQPKIRPSVDPRQDLRFIGQVTNRGSLHPVFHISLLKKCVGDPASLVPLECMDMKDSLSYEDVPVEILNRQVRRLRNKEVASVKVLWRSQSVEGATWEAEAAMKCNVFACPWNSVQSEIQFFVFSGGTHGHHPRTVGGPTVCPAGLWFLLANSPRNQPKIRPSVDPRQDLRFIGQVTNRGSCSWINAPKP
ncbi:hypothetical protein MTR67_030322 [Solanum verrucosum]|uniref:Chromo domain-containing protein n=1 Tax=Solanum verrucosum TaxID=315347 RepID=A0AAF0TXK7_SOLVR|nr:hypothetical protein MTR67_030322 [Solanum verrucosum]